MCLAWLVCESTCGLGIHLWVGWARCLSMPWLVLLSLCWATCLSVVWQVCVTVHNLTGLFGGPVCLHVCLWLGHSMCQRAGLCVGLWFSKSTHLSVTQLVCVSIHGPASSCVCPWLD